MQTIEEILKSFKNSDQMELTISHCSVDDEYTVILSSSYIEPAFFTAETLGAALDQALIFVKEI